MFEQAEILRKFQNLFRIGTVSEIVGDRARVAFDDLETALLPWITPRAGSARAWCPLAIGEQVLVSCLGGDTALGVIVGSLYQTAAPAPSDDLNVFTVTFSDGTVISYDQAAHHLSAVLAAGGTVYIEADAGVSVKGPLHVDGKVTVTETIAADGNISSAGDVSDATSSMQDMRDTFNEHGHPGLNTPPTEKME